MKDKYIVSESKITKQTQYNPLEPMVIKPSTPSYDEGQKVGYVVQRFNEMAIPRATKDREWTLYQRQFEAPQSRYSDGRAWSNVPLERAVIELAVNQLQKLTPERKYKAKMGSEFQALVLQKVRESIYARDNRRVQEINSDYEAAIFGTSVLFNGFEVNRRIINDIDDSSNDDIGFIRKIETKADIIWKTADIRFTYFDDCASHIDNANDCIAIEYVSWENFQNLKLNPSYKNLE